MPVFILLVVLIGVTLAPLGAGPASAQTRLDERVLGDQEAPVTLEEFSSLTCPHCAMFHRDTLPQIKETYIDTGQVKLVYRDFPLDGRALAGSMIARCVKPSRYFGFIETLYLEQEAWAASTDPLTILKRWAKLAGLSGEEVDACLSDQALADALQQRRNEATAERGINSTPTFYVNETVIRGAAPFEDFQAAIESALAKSNTPEKTEAEPTDTQRHAAETAAASGRHKQAAGSGPAADG